MSNTGYRGGRGRGGRGNYDRGRGRGGVRQPRPDNIDRGERFVGYKFLETKSQGTERDALMFCVQPDFIKLLSDVATKNDNKNWVDLMLTTLNRGLQADDSMTSYKTRVKDALLQNQPNFLCQVCDARLTNEIALMMAGVGTGINIDSLVKSLVNFLDIFIHLSALDPLASSGQIMVVMMKLNGLLSHPNMSAANWQLQNVALQYQEATESASRRAQEQLNIEQEKRQARRTGRQLITTRPTDSFRQMSVHPTPADLINQVQLRANRRSGAFDDAEDYLDIQFRLLREDFVSTLRLGIQEYKKSQTARGNRHFRSGHVKVYENFTILTPNFGRTGITYHVQVDTRSKMFKKMNWESSKRLMYGSILCLSLDGFTQNNLFAVIAERDAKNMEKDGIFEIQFLPDSQLEFDSMSNQMGPFLAVESMAYFEAYAHVLTGMTRITEETFPMTDYIVSCKRVVSWPKYLRDEPRVYQFLAKSNGQLESVQMIQETGYGYGYEYGYGNTWPSSDALGFNPAQFEAFKAALTQEFVVIQGPPGTGKTFVGLKIVQALLYNLYNVPCASSNEDGDDVGNSNQNQAGGAMHKLATMNAEKLEVLEASCPPRSLNQLLVVCYTNHALDQFLEGMLQFCPKQDIVRVGSRSKNEVLKDCNLRNKRIRKSQGLFHAYGDLRAQRETFLRENNLDKLKRQMDFCRTAILPHTTEGLWSEYPYLLNQILDFADQLEANNYDTKFAMTMWLGCDPLSFLQSEERTRRENATDSDDEQEDDEPAEEESIDIEGDAERELENRMADEVDDQGFYAQLRKKARSTIVSAADMAEAAVDAEGFQGVKLKQTQKHALAMKIRDLLASSDMATENDIDHYIQRSATRPDLLLLISMEQRWQIYRFLVWKYQHVLAKEMKKLQDMYTQLVKLGEDLKKQEDIETLKTAKVIGMTTTGAARYQHVLQQVGPEIVIVEEAAEVLEAHIVTALSKKCQHLILIGDHKQLKPNPTVYDLAMKFHLDLSLFERMVNNNLPVKTLNIQHRMRPEVSKFMNHIYKDGLRDHRSVMGRDMVEGIEKPVYFFNHNQLESSDEQLMSKSNLFEAQMVVGLTRHLIRQNYEPTDITIITMYTGQLLVIKREMPRQEFQGVKITSVDNFQGEENKIIIISLVRSNTEGKLGFVKIENRVCVTLSRAKYGMYVFGNFDMLRQGSGMWSKMVDEAEKAGELGSKLTLACQTHGNPCDISKPQDFNEKAPAGGCQLPCGARLNCGHKCKMMCHVKDKKHEEYKCPSKCNKQLEYCGHPCPRLCSQKCMPCVMKTQVTLPCQHNTTIACHMQYTMLREEIQCKENCDKLLACGHKCQKKCSEPCSTECKEQVPLTCSVCQETKQLECSFQQRLIRYPSAYAFKCDTKCEVTLVCGHPCKGNCFDCRQGHKQCLKTCQKQLSCGHKCNRKCQDCTDNLQCLDCTQPCLLRCSHDTECNQDCSQPCKFHVEDDGQKCTWGCEHDACMRECGEPCSHTPCDEPCGKKVSCRKNTCMAYTCVGACGDRCPKMCPKCDRKKVIKRANTLPDVGDLSDEKVLWVTLVDCNHVLPVNYMDKIVFGRHYSQPGVYFCPYPECQKPILNTSRYVTKTRLPKQSSITDNPHYRSYNQPRVANPSGMSSSSGTARQTDVIASASFPASSQIYFSPATSKRIYTRDELLQHKEYTSSHTVNSLAVNMPDDIRKAPVPAPRPRRSSPHVTLPTSRDTGASASAIPPLYLSKNNPTYSLDGETYNAGLKDLARKVQNIKQDSRTKPGESMQMTPMMRRLELSDTSSDEGDNYVPDTRPSPLDEMLDHQLSSLSSSQYRSSNNQYYGGGDNYFGDY